MRVLGVEKLDDSSLLTALRGLMFGDFMVPGADPKVYTEIKDQGAMMRVVTDYLADFNATSKKPMHLVIFQVRGRGGRSVRIFARRLRAQGWVWRLATDAST